MGIFTKPSGVAIFENASKGVFIMTTQYGRGADKKWNGPITNSNQCTAYLDRSKTMTAAILLTKYCFALLITIICNLLLYQGNIIFLYIILLLIVSLHYFTIKMPIPALNYLKLI